MFATNRIATATVNRVEVLLDDVRPALRGRRKADPAEASLAAGVHQHERDERRAEEYLEDREHRDHRGGMVATLG